MENSPIQSDQNISIINILAQVFRVVLSHHFQPQTPEKKPLNVELKAAGISDEIIQKSLRWFQQFFAYNPKVYEKLNTHQFDTTFLHRTYAPQELHRIGIEGQQFLTQLSMEHVLSPARREFLMDCIMSEEIAPLTLPQLQFLTFMVLSQDCKRPEEVVWLEEIVLKREKELNTLAH